MEALQANAMTAWLSDHPWPVAIVLGLVVLIVALVLHRKRHEGWSTWGVTILLTVIFTVPMTHLFAVSRDRDQRRWMLRQSHLGQLQAVLRAETEKLADVARRVDVEGRVTDVHKASAGEAELASLFFPDVLSRDIENHYAAYSRDKIRLQRDIREQENNFAETVSLITKSLKLQSLIEKRRFEVALSFVDKCLDKGPGITITRSARGYVYRSRMETNSVVGYPRLPIAPDHSAALAAFESFQPNSEIRSRCESMKRRGALISASAKTLSATARLLSEQSTLPGECKYTRLE